MKKLAIAFLPIALALHACIGDARADSEFWYFTGEIGAGALRHTPSVALTPSGDGSGAAGVPRVPLAYAPNAAPYAELATDIGWGRWDGLYLPVLGFRAAYVTSTGYPDTLTLGDYLYQPGSVTYVTFDFFGIGVRSRGKDTLAGVALKPGLTVLNVTGSVAGSDYSGTVTSPSLRVDGQFCSGSVCAYVAPNLYVYGWLNGASGGVRILL